MHILPLAAIAAAAAGIVRAYHLHSTYQPSLPPYPRKRSGEEIGFDSLLREELQGLEGSDVQVYAIDDRVKRLTRRDGTTSRLTLTINDGRLSSDLIYEELDCDSAYTRWEFRAGYVQQFSCFDDNSTAREVDWPDWKDRALRSLQEGRLVYGV